MRTIRHILPQRALEKARGALAPFQLKEFLLFSQMLWTPAAATKGPAKADLKPQPGDLHPHL